MKYPYAQKERFERTTHLSDATLANGIRRAIVQRGLCFNCWFL